MNAPSELALVANARMPAPRAQSLQVAQASAAFARAGVATTLFYARRAGTPALAPGQELLDWFGVAPGRRPRTEALSCLDWIDRVPRALQYLPARLQELSFSRSAARRLRGWSGAVLSRELECAALLAGRQTDLWLEIHRVPGGRARRRWLRRAAAAARGTIAISRGVRDDLLALGLEPGKVLVEHDGFDARRLEPSIARSEARARLELPQDRVVAVYTGGLLAWKGADVLVEAAALVPEVLFVVAGGMPADVARLRARAGSRANVRIDGFQPPERVPDYLAAADLGVVPNRSRPAISARYTSPLKVFEAMAAGLPLVASDLPSLREILEDGRTALLVRPDDAGALAHGIRHLARDPDLRAALGAALRERAPHHTWDARARRILDWMGA